MSCRNRRVSLLFGVVVVGLAFCARAASAQDAAPSPQAATVQSVQFLSRPPAVAVSAVRPFTLAATPVEYVRLPDAYKQWLPVKGTYEVSLTGSLSLHPSNQYNIQTTIGPFLTPRFQVAGMVGYSKDDSLKTFTYGVEANLHFPTASPALPFIGAYVGGYNTTGGGFTDNSTAIGAQGGVKYFFNPNVAYIAELEYRHLTSGDADRKDTTQLYMGLSTFLAPGGVVPGAFSRDAVNLPTQGTYEAAFSGRISFQPSNQYNIQAAYGPFVTPKIQIAPMLGYSKAGSFETFTYGLEGNLHFPMGRPALPYVGVFGGGIHTSGGGNSDDSTAIGAQGGIKYFLTSRLALITELDYRHPTSHRFGQMDTTQINLGFGTYFDKK